MPIANQPVQGRTSWYRGASNRGAQHADRARGTQRVSPRDVTGTRARELLREKQAKENQENNVAQAVRTARLEGFNAGHEAGWNDFVTALYSLYKSDGFDAVGEYLAELDEARGVTS